MFAMVQAGSMGVPYIPVMGLVGSDALTNRDDMRIEPDPFDPSRRSVVARAYRPDLALLHGRKADRRGNVWLGRNSDDVLLAEASQRTIVTVEEIVDRLDETETREALPAVLIDAVVEAPFGAHPAGCPGLYPADGVHMARYLEAARDDESFRVYLQETVHDVPDHAAYVERLVPTSLKRQAAAGGGDLSRSA